MVNISIYPYGNANERQSGGEWTFTCQHGANECDGNMVETCFINLVNFDQTKFMQFILDFEKEIAKNSRNIYQTAQTMLQGGKYPVTWAQLSPCIGSSGAQGGTTGNTYEHQMALWTDAANHQYTPWITLNGKHNTVIQNECTASTLQCTCAQYKGTNSCCSKFKNEPMDDVCWKHEKPRK
eukprot:130257_1